jgi:transcriptional regulator GlxA family with amidase domain
MSIGKQINIGILLIPDYGMMAYANLIHVFNAANLINSSFNFHYRTIAADANTRSNEDILVNIDTVLPQQQVFDYLFIVASKDAATYADQTSLHFIRQQAAIGCHIAGITSGTWLMAKAGLLEQQPATVHWMDLIALKETYPQVEVLKDRYLVAEKLSTCAGGSATIDLAMKLIGRHLSDAQTMAIAARLIHTSQNDAKVQADIMQLPQTSTDRRIRETIKLMNEHISQPLGMGEICLRLKVNQRTLEALFKRQLQITPKHCYLNIRLSQAKNLLRTRVLPITDIAFAVGFSTPSTFSTAYKKWAGYSPKLEMTFEN